MLMLLWVCSSFIPKIWKILFTVALVMTCISLYITLCSNIGNAGNLLQCNKGKLQGQDIDILVFLHF